MKQCWPAPERNKGPILEVLKRVLPARGVLLEIASGSGQHAAFFARELPGLRVQPSDVDAENLASIGAYVQEAGLDNLLPARTLDVRAQDWGVGSVDAIFNANMIHIAPWECAEGLFAGVARHLAGEGVLVLYGPFRVNGSHTAPSNEAFDARLKSQNASWGVRDLEAVCELASDAGLVLSERVQMPANNLTLVFRRAAAVSPS